ncbi:MAG: glycosyltransferase [Clostridia bacterium]|nr:glycosyltransferase [Clostridia bacterium]
MKILVVASSMVHINNFHLPYIDALKENGHDVYVMANGEGADFNIPFKKRALSLENYKLSKKIRQIIKDNSFDCVLLHTTLAAFWVRRALKGVEKRPRVINTVHGYLFGKSSSKLHNFLYLFLEKRLRKQTDVILTMNSEDYEIANNHKLALEKVVKINGMGFKPLDFEYTPKNNKNLIFVGEISKRKNQIMLIKVLKYLPDYTLTLVGDGSEKKSLEKLAKKENVASRVQITGFTKDISSHLKMADIYVSASKIEGLPFNILEAMSVKMPILASNIKGHSDLLPKKSLFELNDIRALASKIKGVKLERADYDISSYTHEIAFSQNMELYKELLEK